MPELDIGDFLIFRNMGSYTKSCARDFCGIKLPDTIYYSSELYDKIKGAYEGEENKNFVQFKDFNKKLSAETILDEIMNTAGKKL